MTFVTFNKVSTAQYFIWYHALLPLVLPSSEALLPAHLPRTAAVVAAWTITLLSWLGCAYLLEFGGYCVFVAVWIASVAFFAANVALVHHAIRMHVPTALFRGGQLAEQAVVWHPR